MTAPCARAVRPGLAALLLTAIVLAALAPAGAAESVVSVPQSALQSCAGIAGDTERLACYDRLAARVLHGASTVVAPAAPATAAAAPPRASAAAGSPPAATPGVAASGATTAGSAAAPLPTESFGLYQAEHPKPAVATSIEAQVVALGKSASGRMTVSLEGGAVWELEEPDPLLAVGETVTVTRASLGSYLMHTATKRTHRVRRLR